VSPRSRAICRTAASFRHHEILRRIALRAGQPVALDPDDLERETAWQADGVIQYVARIGRDTTDRVIFAASRKEPLRQFGWQIVMDLQLAPDDAMRLGMDRADAVAIVVGSRIEDMRERLLHLVDGVAFLGLHVFDLGGEYDGGLHRGSPCGSPPTHVG